MSTFTSNTSIMADVSNLLFYLELKLTHSMQNNDVPSSSEKPIHERQGEEAATEQPKPDSADKDTEEKKSGGDNEGGAAPDNENSSATDPDPDRKKEVNAIAKGHHGDGKEGPGVKSGEEMEAAAAKAKGSAASSGGEEKQE